MSLTEEHIARRRRLLTPPNGRDSSELDIVSDAVARRIEAEKRAEIRAANEERERNRRIWEAKAEAKRLREEAIKAEEDWIKGRHAKSVQIRSIIDYCCKKYNTKPLDILSMRRTAGLCHVRFIIVYLCCTLTDRSYPQIGRCIGGRDHTTIMHAKGKIMGMIAADPEFAAEIEAIKAALKVPE